MIVAKPLIDAQFAPASQTLIYTAPDNTRVIIDKFTATNTDGSARTISVWIVPSDGSVGDSNQIIRQLSINSNTVDDITELQNHILDPGDKIYVQASVTNVVNVRASGREVS